MLDELEELLDKNPMLGDVNRSVVVVAVVVVVGVATSQPGIVNSWGSIEVPVLWLIYIGIL